MQVRWDGAAVAARSVQAAIKEYSYEAFNRPSIMNSSLHNFRFQSPIFLTAVRSSQTKLHKKRPDTGYLDLDAA